MIDFSDLETPVESIPVKKTEERPQFPCVRCNGTGKYVFGYRNPQVGKCHACNGRGYFLTSPEYRAKSRKAAAERKVAKADSNWEAFAEQEPAAAEWLASRADRSDFARSLSEGVRKWGSLTEKQLAAVHNCIAKDQERAAERNAAAVQLSLEGIFSLFESAQQSGLKRPRVNLVGFKFSLAPASGRNAGHIYVKDEDGEYLGKVAPGGAFHKSRECTQEQVQALVDISADVISAAVAFGQQTGCCSFCQRELTDKRSVDVGYGPICADNYGLPWGDAA